MYGEILRISWASCFASLYSPCKITNVRSTHDSRHSLQDVGFESDSFTDF